MLPNHQTGLSLLWKWIFGRLADGVTVIVFQRAALVPAGGRFIGAGCHAAGTGREKTDGQTANAKTVAIQKPCWIFSPPGMNGILATNEEWTKHRFSARKLLSLRQSKLAIARYRNTCQRNGFSIITLKCHVRTF